LRDGGHLMSPLPAPEPSGELSAAPGLPTAPEGIGHIEQTGSDDWTDYNTHDPGISILEALAYTITELAHRTGFPIEDILASSATDASAEDPYPDQTFYSARTILTVNPTTVEDIRRLLINVDPVRNAWVRCGTCADAPFFAWCEDGALVLSHDPSQRNGSSTEAMRVEPRGLYAVLLELEADATFGDLNDRKIVRRRTVTGVGATSHDRVRFPGGTSHRDERQRLAEDVTRSRSPSPSPIARRQAPGG
jgi:hypothetical protein